MFAIKYLRWCSDLEIEGFIQASPQLKRAILISILFYDYFGRVKELRYDNGCKELRYDNGCKELRYDNGCKELRYDNGCKELMHPIIVSDISRIQ